MKKPNEKQYQTKKIWKFITDQFIRCQKRMDEKNYRDAIDLIYDIAGNISNLYWFIEHGQISTDKGKVLNNLSIIFRNSVFSEDYGAVLRAKWELRNIAKYGYFASGKIVLKDVEIPEAELQNLFKLLKKMFEEFENYFKKINLIVKPS